MLLGTATGQAFAGPAPALDRMSISAGASFAKPKITPPAIPDDAYLNMRVTGPSAFVKFRF